jgi:hypothetical protein
MKAASLAALALIIIGIALLAYQGITRGPQKKILHIAALHATRKEQKTVPLPDIVACITLLGGVGIIAFRPKSNF